MPQIKITYTLIRSLHHLVSLSNFFVLYETIFNYLLFDYTTGPLTIFNCKNATQARLEYVLLYLNQDQIAFL